MVDMDPIMEIARKHNLLVLEDAPMRRARNTAGRKAGNSIGDFGCFSFHSLKNITTLGEGGMITTNNDDYVEKITHAPLHEQQGLDESVRILAALPF